MRRLLPLASLFALACAPEAELAVEAGDADALLLQANGVTLDLFQLERCNDGVDNDGDRRIDRDDPDCRGDGVWVAGHFGFYGSQTEGSGIHGNPLDRGSLDLFESSAEVSYSPGDHRRGIPPILLVTQPLARGTATTAFQLASEVDQVVPVLGDGDRYSSLVVVTMDGTGYLAEGPIGGVTYLERP